MIYGQYILVDIDNNKNERGLEIRIINIVKIIINIEINIKKKIIIKNKII